MAMSASSGLVAPQLPKLLGWHKHMSSTPRQQTGLRVCSRVAAQRCVAIFCDSLLSAMHITQAMHASVACMALSAQPGARNRACLQPMPVPCAPCVNRRLRAALLPCRSCWLSQTCRPF